MAMLVITREYKDQLMGPCTSDTRIPKRWDVWVMVLWPSILITFDESRHRRCEQRTLRWVVLADDLWWILWGWGLVGRAKGIWLPHVTSYPAKRSGTRRRVWCQWGTLLGTSPWRRARCVAWLQVSGGYVEKMLKSSWGLKDFERGADYQTRVNSARRMIHNKTN